MCLIQRHNTTSPMGDQTWVLLIRKIAAHSAYDMFSWYKYLIVSLVFSHLGFWSGNLFLIAPFPDLCLLVPFYRGIPIFFVICHDLPTTNHIR